MQKIFVSQDMTNPKNCLEIILLGSKALLLIPAPLLRSSPVSFLCC
ncbi:unnamed protein product [Musa acuminata subsp. burmannicoides]